MGREILHSENKQSWKPEFTVLRQKIEWLQYILNNILYYIIV